MPAFLCGVELCTTPTKAARSGCPSAWFTAGLIALFAGWLCTGCLPLKFNTSPGASGRIVDAASHAPLTGAEIVVSYSTYPPESPDKAFANARQPLAVSQEGGQFLLPPQRRWDLYCVPIDIFPRFGLLVVKVQGHETTCIPFWSRTTADLGDIPVRAGSAAK